MNTIDVDLSKVEQELIPGTSVFLAVIDEDKREIKVWISKRLVEDYKGYWQNPGGKMMVGESTRDAAIREVEEETGIRLPGYAIFPLMHTTHLHPAVHAKYTVYHYYTTIPPGLVPRQTEPDKSTKWELLDLQDVLCGVREVTEGNRLYMPGMLEAAAALLELRRVLCEGHEHE